MKSEEDLRAAVEKAVSEMNLLMARDGGSLELEGVTPEGLVRLRLRGACADCTGSLPPMAKGIERVLKEQVPEVDRVVIQSP